MCAILYTLSIHYSTVMSSCCTNYSFVVQFCKVCTLHCTAPRPACTGLYNVQACTMYGLVHIIQACTYNVQVCTMYRLVQCTGLYNVQTCTKCTGWYNVQTCKMYRLVQCTDLYKMYRPVQCTGCLPCSQSATPPFTL